jgi:hypothetical protein
MGYFSSSQLVLYKFIQANRSPVGFLSLALLVTLLQRQNSTRPPVIVFFRKKWFQGKNINRKRRNSMKLE